VLFQKRFWPLLADGSVTVTFRRWKQRQAVAGGRYRTPSGFIEVDRAEIVEPSSVTDADAVAAGYPSAEELLAGLGRRSDAPLYRIDFHYVGTHDPRAELASDAALSAEDEAEITRRLRRMDAAASGGPWTASTLRLIGEHPGTRAPDLAASVGRETIDFKRDVRKLKALGLTTSLRIGYELSPRGVAYLARLDR
jgi:hypothetical protein